MSDSTPVSRTGLLDRIERIGNRLPDPTMLFIGGTLIIMVVSAIAVSLGWSVERVTMQAITNADGSAGTQLVGTGVFVEPFSLLSRDGLDWVFSNMVKNFVEFDPLGIVLTGMLGIGVAERTGLLAALLKAFMAIVPAKLLTPAMVFLGIMSSMGLDAGYIVLPPLAAMLYIAVGRSPLAGIAAVFAGVSAGFNANLLVTGLDPMLSGLSTEGAQLLDENYAVAPTCNWYFMIASTFIMTLAGWWVSSALVEPRLRSKPADDGGPVPEGDRDPKAHLLNDDDRRGLRAAGIAGVIVVGALLALVLIPGAPLYTAHAPDPASIGENARMITVEIVPNGMALEEAERPAGAFVHNDQLVVPSTRRFDRWVDAIVPMIFLSFLIPGLAFGAATGSVKSSKDAAEHMIEAMKAMAPIIVLAFFAGQFIALFNQSNLGTMLAIWGGSQLANMGLSAGLLMVAFVLVTMVFNLFVGSMSAKYALFAPIFVPMFMMIGISPELTQAAYRIGDSVTNVITPLNAYLVIILVFMQKHAPKSGLGTLVAMMLPYSIVFLIAWTILLLMWLWLGIPLGPAGPLSYSVGG
ncbi:MAG: AbgT family transporter [Phycisphaeraceae bacterium]|nr:AbgT family transporter [Phycisphaerales bacterium]MCB9858964.1 AbgT family transporter [Phycisphaeraceae bacterium]